MSLSYYSSNALVFKSKEKAESYYKKFGELCEEHDPQDFRIRSLLEPYGLDPNKYGCDGWIHGDLLSGSKVCFLTETRTLSLDVFYTIAEREDAEFFYVTGMDDRIVATNDTDDICIDFS